MNHVDLDSIRLISGSGRGDELCVMQWVARLAHVDDGEQPTDHPSCTSPVLTSFAISFNDAADDETRQKLVPFIPRLVGTAGDAEADAVRAWLATDWLVRTYTPTWLRKAGLTAEADALVALPQLTSTELAAAAQPIIEDAGLRGARGRGREGCREDRPAAARRPRLLGRLLGRHHG